MQPLYKVPGHPTLSSWKKLLTSSIVSSLTLSLNCVKPTQWSSVQRVCSSHQNFCQYMYKRLKCLQFFAFKPKVKTVAEKLSFVCRIWQDVKLTFFPNSHLAPKYFKVVANSKKLVAITTHTKRNNFYSVTVLDRLKLLMNHVVRSSQTQWKIWPQNLHVLQRGH